MNTLARRLSGRVHYGWIVVAVIFLVLLAAAGIRATPSVLIIPLEQDFGWSRSTISLAIAIGIALYGLMGPFAAALMQRIGIRPTVLLALVLLAVGIMASTAMTAAWQMVLIWGVLVGSGSGIVAITLGATVVNRWFTERRGLAMGILTASSATGQLVFLPMLASVVEHHGWRPVAWIVAAAALALTPIVLMFVPERPADVALRPYGEPDDAENAAPATRANPIVIAFSALGRASRSGDFWLLFGSFFICGASANGLIGTHLIAFCFDHGIPEVQAAGLLAMMGVFDMIGTTASGWLSDRYNNRVLLFWYYGLRGLSLLYLPFSDFSLYGLSLFAVFYGLDWIATVPPTLRLTTDIFGKQDAPVIFGWIVAGHQIGAGTIAFLAGVTRSEFGSYFGVFFAAGALCLIASVLVLRIGRANTGSGELAPALAGSA